MAFVNLTKKLDQMDRVYGRSRKSKGGAGGVLTVLLILIIATVIPGFFIYTGLKGVSAHGKAIVTAYKAQNFDQLKQAISDTKGSLEKVDLPLKFLFWMRIIPLAGGYYIDAQKFADAALEEMTAVNSIFTSLESSKSELGFDGHPKSGPDRITQAIRILDKAMPSLDKYQSNLTKASDLVKDIDVNKYPETIKGKTVRKNLEVLKNFIMGAAVAVKDGKDALGLAPSALGLNGARNYLMLFQNDKEIRATGGFITAYATITMNNGQVSATTSDDIYRLDEKLLNVCLTKICPLTPPAPIVKYLPEVSGKPRSAWSIRDSNLSPDVPTSAQQFEKMYKLLGTGLPFDGIIYIDSQVVESLIEVTGPIDVFGTTYSAQIDKRCNCPNVIYELESYAEIAAKGEKDRKAVLGVLMQQILAKSVGGAVEKLPQLIETIATLANHKHIMFYMHDNNLENALSQLNWTGQIKNYDGDYLHINDSNFAGGKSNLYVTQTVTQDVTVKGNEVIKKITIDYSNPQQFNSWLNGINRDYVRFYVPSGSKLISSRGSEVPVTTTADLGKTVFEAFIQVRPQNSRKLEIEYSIPYQPKGQYKLLIQKQPGAKDFEYKVKINGTQKADFKLDQDKDLQFGI